MSIFVPETWLASPQGRYILEWEQQWMNTALSNIFGYNALQLGLPQQDFMRENRIPLRQILDENNPCAHLRCEFTRLPFASQSIDLVILPHILEFHHEPHQILWEVERILIPEGRLFILGFNPLSLWGLRRLFSARSRNFPWNGHYLSLPRLKDWLKLLNFETDRGAFGCYAPPCKTARWLQRWHFMELAGNRWWGFAGGVYIIRAVKRVYGMHLILPAWETRKLENKALTPVTRQSCKEPPDA